MWTSSRLRTSSFIFILLLSSLLAHSLSAKTKKDNTPQEKAPLLSGIAVGIDLCGISMKALNSRFANMEVCGRLNLKEKYFPIVELGIGDCTKKGGENSNVFSCTSPYWRVGIDYNINKKHNGNRFFGGVRYAFTNYKYNFTSPGLVDPVYGQAEALELTDISGKNQWLELVTGVETKLWSIVRLGWDLRFRFRTAQKVSDMGEPYYVPGFGKNDVSTFGGTVHLMFDVGKTAKKNGGKKKESESKTNKKDSKKNKKKEGKK